MTRSLAIALSLFCAAPVYAAITFTTDDALTCGSDASVDGFTAVSVVARIYPTTLTGDELTIAYKGSNIALGSGINWGLLFGDFFANGADAYIVYRSYTLTDQWLMSANSTVSLNTWQFSAFTSAGTSATATTDIKIYGGTTPGTIALLTNGASQNGTGTLENGSTHNLTVGARDDGSGGFNIFGEARIEEVCVYNVVLTLAEIQQISDGMLHRQCLQIQPSALKAAYTLDNQPEGTSADADTFVDYSGNGNTCTGNDGANNTGLTMIAGPGLSYP